MYDTESLVGFHCYQNMTLNDLEVLFFKLNSVLTPLCPASETVTFENSCIKTNRGRPTLSAAST